MFAEYIVFQVKDIVEEAIEDKLDNNHFPFLGGQRQNKGGAATTRSVREAFQKKKLPTSRTWPKFIKPPLPLGQFRTF